MPYTFYKFFHLAGIFLMLISLSGIASHVLQGGTKTNFKNRKFFGTLHGIGMLISFIAGFGLIAKGGFSFGSGWVLSKIVLWFILGAFPVVFYKKGHDKKPLFALMGILGLILFLVEYKPF